MLAKNKKIVNKKIGSFILSLAHGRAGARATPFFFYSKSPASLAKRTSKQAGKKEGGLGEGIFARLLCRAKRGMGWEAAAHSALAERQSRKFFFLKEKNKKEMTRAKISGKIFCFARPACRQAGVKADAAAGRDCRPAGGNQKSATGFSLKKVRISSKTRSQ